MSPEVISVGGAKGIGKTTALKELGRLTSASVIHISFELNRFSQEHHGKRLRELTIFQRDRVRMDYGNSLAERLVKTADRMYLDFHYIDVREDPDKILHPESLLSIINNFAVVVAAPEVIQARRSSDKEEKRSLDLEEIKIEQNLEATCARKLAVFYNKQFSQVNGESSVKEVVSRLLRLSTIIVPEHSKLKSSDTIYKL